MRNSITHPEKPFEMVGIDFLGPLPATENSRHSAPRELLSDKGANFMSEIIQQVARTLKFIK